MDSVFEIIAEPNRRAILSLLVSSQQSVGEIERRLRMPQPTVSKHLRVLREAGFVESTVDAQRRLYRLKPEPLQEVDVWLAQFRRFWSVHVDALERHLDRMDQSTPTKRKTRRRRPRLPVHARRSFLLHREVGHAQRFQVVDMVHECREPQLLILSCCLTYPLQRTGRVFPARCPGRVLLWQVPFGQSSSLHPLRHRL